VPWNDPLHLTLSFAPDGTTAAGQPSRLTSALDAQMPRAVWQNVILKAFQTWAEVASVNVGVVADGGQPFGATGDTQRDPRFGDIRVGGFPMTAAALAVSVPPASFVTGTYAGDLFVNTAAAFTPDTLYAVALHEAGHALGLPHSTDPRSVMFSHLNRNTTLTAGDVAAVRELYGPRSADLNEGNKGNDTVKNATRLKYSATSGGFTGSTPVVGYGDITTRTDADIFHLKQLNGYTGPISFRVQTADISLLAPSVTVTDSAGRVLATRTATGTRGDTLTITLPTTRLDETYFVKITAAPGTTNPIGRFAVAGTFDARLRPTAISLDAVMRGPYETLKPEEQQKLFTDPNAVFFDDDLHTNDTVALAVNLRPGPGNPSDRHLQTTASLSDGTDADWYRVRAPDSVNNQPWVLTTTLRAVSPNGVAPRVEVYDGNLVRVAAQVIVNGNGTFTVQAAGAQPGRSYYLKVFSPTATGNYAVDVTFGTAAADLRTLATNTLTQATPTASFKLYIGQTQLFSTTLSATGAAGAVRLEVVNSAGVIVHSLTTGVGETTSGFSSVLAPGEYTVRFTAVGATGPIAFTLRGTGITDPIGPVPAGGTLAPQYQLPGDPTRFQYPNGTITSDPYLFLFWFLA
jgi:Matrixin